MEDEGKKYCSKGNNQKTVSSSWSVKIPQLLWSEAKIEMDRAIITIFDAIATDDTVTIIIYQKGMPKHGAAILLIVTAKTCMLTASIEAEMPV